MAVKKRRIKQVSRNKYILKIPRSMPLEGWRKMWGIPGWEKENEYPQKLSHDQWRWEFLRRTLGVLSYTNP
jgi:hypothetical protein